jgi:hypothetical protein
MMMSSRALLFGLCLLAVPRPALAVDPVDDDAQVTAPAQDLIQQGISLRHSGQDEAALGVFLDAEKRAPNSVRVLLHVTAAAQAAGRWLLAYQYLQKASAYKSTAYYQRYRASIRGMEETVAQHVGQFRVAGSPAGAEVLINGELMGTLPLEGAKVLEVGSYVLEVRKPGFFPLRRPFTIAPGGGLAQETVELKPGVLGSKDDSGAGASRSGVRGGPSEPRSSGLGARWITWTLAGSGAALLATSTVAFVIREQKASHWNDSGRCLAEGDPTVTRQQLCGSVRSDANTAQTIGIATGAVGVGLVGGAIAHWLWTSDSSQRNSVGLASCGVGPGSVLCSGSF